MLTIPNPDMPAEIDEIEQIMHDLMDCQVRNRYDLGALDKWLMDKPDPLFEAVQRLRQHLEQIYPPTIITPEKVNKEAAA